MGLQGIIFKDDRVENDNRNSYAIKFNVIEPRYQACFVLKDHCWRS